jgi:hypothetical protein
MGNNVRSRYANLVARVGTTRARIDIRVAVGARLCPPYALNRGTSREALPLSIACMSAAGNPIFRSASI